MLLSINYADLDIDALHHLLETGDDSDRVFGVLARLMISENGEYRRLGSRLFTGFIGGSVGRDEASRALLDVLSEIGVAAVPVLEDLALDDALNETLRARAWILFALRDPSAVAQQWDVIVRQKFRGSTLLRLKVALCDLGLRVAFTEVLPEVFRVPAAYAAVGHYLQSPGARMAEVNSALDHLRSSEADMPQVEAVDIDKWLALPESLRSDLEAETSLRSRWFTGIIADRVMAHVSALLLPNEVALVYRARVGSPSEMWGLISSMVPLESVFVDECRAVQRWVDEDQTRLPSLGTTVDVYERLIQFTQVLQIVARYVDSRLWVAAAEAVERFGDLLSSDLMLKLASTAAMVGGTWRQVSSADCTFYIIWCSRLEGVHATSSQLRDRSLVREFIARNEGNGSLMFHGAALLIHDDPTDASGYFYAGLGCFLLGQVGAATEWILSSARLASPRQAVQGAATIRETAGRLELQNEHAEALASLLDGVAVPLVDVDSLGASEEVDRRGIAESVEGVRDGG